MGILRVYRLFKEKILTRTRLAQSKIKKQRDLSIAVLYRVPLASNKYELWHDGFTAAIEELSARYDVHWINTAAVQPSRSMLESMDFLIVKANWGWGPDQFLRTRYPDLITRKGLMISGVADPPAQEDMEYYDVLYYETEWYKPKISSHSNIIHAFGIDGRVMRPLEKEIAYDVISVGVFRPYKRYHKILNKTGQILAIGDIESSNKEIVQELRDGGVEVKGFVSYDKLAHLFNASDMCYIPAELNGGGERAVLEARACGTPVEVEDDNPKLKELLNVPIWDHVYYAEQLEKGILQ